MGFKNPLEDPEVVSTLYKTHFFAGALTLRRRGRSYHLGAWGDVRWPKNPFITPSEMLYVMKKIFGPPNAFSCDKVTFNYVFKSAIPDVYYEIRDYCGFLSCGIGVPKDMHTYINKRLTEKINKGLKELIKECVVAYNLI